MLFLPIWYEGYDEPAWVWQSSAATDSFEPKYSLVPLIFGTLKATFHSMLFGLPLALIAAIYTSEFLHPSTRAKIKPTVEMMASLPSVVLGFLAALVFAPAVVDVVPGPAVDDVLPVLAVSLVGAGTTAEHIRARPAKQHVLALLTFEGVLTGTAVEQVVAACRSGDCEALEGAANITIKHVVAVAAIEQVGTAGRPVGHA